MPRKEYYTIVAGSQDRPETIDMQFLEKGSGQTRTEGEVFKVLNKRSSVAIPNYTKAWGIRLDKEGNIPETPLQVKDPAYRGQIKELKWGAAGGTVIECRYLKGYTTIDLQYQNLVMNANANFQEDTEAAAEVAYLFFQSGDNFFDPESDPYLVQMLRVHKWNETSEYRDPEGGKFLLWEKNFEEEAMRSEASIDSKREALNIIADAATDNSGDKLKNLLQVVKMISNEEPKEIDIYRYLQMLADSKGGLFVNEVKKYKAELSDNFERLKSEKLIDLNADGIIAIGEGNAKIINTDIPGKKDKMVQWVLDNILDPKAWSIAQQVKKIIEKLK